MTGIEALVQFIVRYGMKDLIVGPAGIIPMDHFAHQPEIFFFLRSSPAHLFHEIKGQAVCTVQTDAVDVKLPDPEMDHIKKVISHSLFVKVQIDQFKTVSPGLISKSVIIGAVPAEIHTLVPVDIGGMFPVFLNILKSKKFTAGMVKHTVHNYPDPGFMAFFHKFLKVLIITQTTVYFFIVLRIIPVGGGFKKRTDINSCHPEIFHMIDPGKELLHPVLDLCPFVSLWCAKKAQRINMIKNCLVIPVSHCVLFLQIYILHNCSMYQEKAADV